MVLAPLTPAPRQWADGSKPKRLGLIQSRGIGDIIIALPIARWYHARGIEVYWPIDGNFLGSFQDAVDYVQFIPFSFTPSMDGFLHEPERLLRAISCDRTVVLYSFLSNVPSPNPGLFATLKFDEYKYAATAVPFGEKWNLSIKRNHEREQAFYDRVVQREDYIVVHRHGSNVRSDVAVPGQYSGHQIIEIDEQTDSIFDWLLVLERAKFLLLIDSCFSNLVDQLGFTNEKMFILRSEVRFTPVLRSNWQFCGVRNALREWSLAPQLDLNRSGVR